MADGKHFDRSTEDVGNIQLLEHVNLTVPDQGIAAMFYVTGLGFTRDPYIDFGTRNMWVNLGDQQFHLPKGEAQVLRGHIGVVVPGFEGLRKRLRFAATGLKETKFNCIEAEHHIDLTCPYGNHIRVYEAGAFPHMDLGMPYVQFDVPKGAAAGIARFYQKVIGSAASLEGGVATVKASHNQMLKFAETDDAIGAYDGHHLAVYLADFSGPHSWLKERGLISEESDQFQYRFQKIVDPDSGELLFEIEHEVRSLSHAMYRRPLANRNPDLDFFSYRRGQELFWPKG